MRLVCLKLRPMKMTMKHIGFALVLACGAIFVARAQDAAAPASTTMTGVFTQAQVDSGTQIYRASCAEGCHLWRLDGSGKAKPLVGDSFKGNWRGKNLAELYQFISVKMPWDFPATLTPEENASVMAYVLSQNGFPVGTQPLTTDSTALAGIVFADE